uniref:Uncharacterized protein n=1 Tax=Cacopsylla melanoneura TaxID=428564 RepID=A0A8D8X3S0_9HEMI
MSVMMREAFAETAWVRRSPIVRQTITLSRSAISVSILANCSADSVRINALVVRGSSRSSRFRLRLLSSIPSSPRSIRSPASVFSFGGSPTGRSLDWGQLRRRLRSIDWVLKSQ